MTARSARRALLALAFAAGMAAHTPARGAGPDQAPNLRAQIEALAARHGVRVLGAQRIEQSAAQAAPGDLSRALEVLLADYNFAVIRGADGAIETLSISGRKRPAPDLTHRITVKTLRRGASHYLSAVIMGRRPARSTVEFLVDTGASMVVLPLSMAEPLGYDEADLSEVVLQTANGEARGWTGTLRSVEVGQAVARDVAVAFVDDERLGRNRLLGMSFLGRFVVTIDDAANVMSLTRAPD